MTGTPSSRRSDRAAPARTALAATELLDLLGQRWTLRILLELRARDLTFRALRERLEGVSPSLLNNRLHDLRQADLVAVSLAGYELTALGRELDVKLLGVTTWAERWSRKRRPPSY